MQQALTPLHRLAMLQADGDKYKARCASSLAAGLPAAVQPPPTVSSRLKSRTTSAPPCPACRRCWRSGRSCRQR
jgi:hypothetical protein